MEVFGTERARQLDEVSIAEWNSDDPIIRLIQVGGPIPVEDAIGLQPDGGEPEIRIIAPNYLPALLDCRIGRADSIQRVEIPAIQYPRVRR